MHRPNPRRAGRSPLLTALSGIALALLGAFVVLPGGGPPVAWSHELGAQASYRAGTGGGLLAFCTDDETLHVLDMASGEELWSCSDRRCYNAACIVDGRVLVPAIGREVVAFDARTGEELWAVPELGIVQALVPAGDEVLVGRASGFVALDPKTGRELWRRSTRNPDDEWCKTEDLSVVDGVAYVAYRVDKDFELSFGNRRVADGGVYAFDLASRRVLWFAPIDERVMHPPTVEDDTVVVVTRSGLFDTLYALDRSDGSIRWEREGARGLPHASAGTVCFEGVDGEITKQRDVPILHERYALTGVDLATGEEEWSHGSSGDGSRSLELDDLVLFSRGETIHALHADSGDRAWSLGLDAPTSAPFVTADGSLVVFTADARVTAYDLDG